MKLQGDQQSYQFQVSQLCLFRIQLALIILAVAFEIILLSLSWLVVSWTSVGHSLRLRSVFEISVPTSSVENCNKFTKIPMVLSIAYKYQGWKFPDWQYFFNPQLFLRKIFLPLLYGVDTPDYELANKSHYINALTSFTYNNETSRPNQILISIRISSLKAIYMFVHCTQQKIHRMNCVGLLTYRLETGCSSTLACCSCSSPSTAIRTSGLRQTDSNLAWIVMHDKWPSSKRCVMPGNSLQHTHSSAVGITWHCPHWHQFESGWRWRQLRLSFCAPSRLFLSLSAMPLCRGWNWYGVTDIIKKSFNCQNTTDIYI